jgi:predicted DNA-binding transcriptional regulator AlpA
VTSDRSAHLRAIAEALPPGSGVTVPRDWLLELLETTLTPAASVQTSTNGAGTPEDQLLTVQEVADRFGLSKDWLYRHWQAVGGVKLGRKVLRFPATALPRYLAARRKAP